MISLYMWVGLPQYVKHLTMKAIECSLIPKCKTPVWMSRSKWDVKIKSKAVFESSVILVGSLIICSNNASLHTSNSCFVIGFLALTMMSQLKLHKRYISLFLFCIWDIVSCRESVNTFMWYSGLYRQPTIHALVFLNLISIYVASVSFLSRSSFIVVMFLISTCIYIRHPPPWWPSFLSLLALMMKPRIDTSFSIRSGFSHISDTGSTCNQNTSTM